MSTRSTIEIQEPLVKQLNTLLSALHIPISLASPIDLTPSLLIAILAQLMDEKIPTEISPYGRPSRNVQSMKFFIGVLESDIIQQDVGLSNIDPQRLASGEWHETVFIGELLCWIGRDRGLINNGDSEVTAYLKNQAPSPTISAMSILTRKTASTSNFSLHRRSESNTSVSVSVGSNDTFYPNQSGGKRSRRPHTRRRPRPRCIHEIPSPSVVLSPELGGSFIEQGYCQCVEPSHPEATAKVRRTGYIEPVDEDLELQSFESMRRMQGTHKREGDNIVDHQYDFIQLREARARNIALLNERARLLEELAMHDYPP
ncbi:hypothetical protein BDZ94DRAFT_1270513 [Collybia nuda]|uniref:Uncharacterized protein n=1 Tax=Collybia nuda TaxID=64659 RepID=A0A9P5XVN3_9AGAR|nr:hypothetical protein BDZ94DRAFT_1270513 [Collybia nuda]